MASETVPAQNDPVTPMDRVRCARKIAAMRAERPPKTWRRIGREVGLSENQCKRILRQLRAAGDPDSRIDPMAPIQRHLDVLETTMYEASQTYADAKPGSAVRVGALKVFKEASADWLDMLRLVGVLPRHLGAVSAEREMQALFREAAELARQHDVSDEFIDALLRLSERRLTRTAIEGYAMSVPPPTT